MDRNGSKGLQELLASMFFGTTISFILLGVTCCQVIWYFRFQSRSSSKCMKLLILLIWLGESLDCVFMVCVTLHTFLGPAIARAKARPEICRYWGWLAQKIASELSTFLVEGFFIIRMWRFSGKKRLAALVFIPYIAGNVMTLGQIVYGIRLLCNPSVKFANPIFLFAGFGCKLFADGVTVFTMCYMLFARSLGFTRRTNTIKIVRGLILWTISTGLLTWFNTVVILASNTSSYSVGIYYVRTGFYANAMLAQLNARPRYQAMAGATIPYSIHLDTMSLGQRVNRESRPDNAALNPIFRDGSPIQT